MKKAKKSMRQKTKMAGAKPKMACGGRVKKMQSGGQVNDPTKARRVLPDGTVVYVDPKTGRRIGGGGGSGPTNRGTTGLAGAARREAARRAGTAPTTSKGVSKGSVQSLITKLMKQGMSQATAAKKAAAKNKKRGIKYIK